MIKRFLQRWAARNGYLSPDQYQQRRRIAAARSRSFQAAQISRLVSGWTTHANDVDYDLLTEWDRLLARARDLAKNNDYVRRYLSLRRINVVGPHGIRLQGNVRDDDGNLDQFANRNIETAWREWGRRGSPEVTGTMSWLDLQRGYDRALARDGEYLAVIERDWRENRYGYAIRPLDPLLLDWRLNKRVGQNEIVMGVELNRDRRPVAYWLLDDVVKPRSQPQSQTSRRVPADQVIHRFNREFAFQTRGYTPLVSAMTRVRQLEGYEEAVVVNARNAASTCGIFIDNEENEGILPDDIDASGEQVFDAEAGTFRKGPNGMEFQQYDPKQPTDRHKDFVSVNLRALASGVNVAYESLANDREGVNYSSLRAGVVEDRDNWRDLQQSQVSDFNSFIYWDWLRMQILRGTPIMNGAPLRADQDRYQVAWQARGWTWVDPLKDVQAAVLAIQNALDSRSNIIRSGGRDSDEVWSEHESDNAELESKGIEIVPAAVPLTAGPSTEGDDED